jgi:predicted MFS family arabinose efflux permease
MTLMFIGGALGAVAGTMIYHRGGWNAAAVTGILLGVAPFLLFMVELGTSKAVK